VITQKGTSAQLYEPILAKVDRVFYEVNQQSNFINPNASSWTKKSSHERSKRNKDKENVSYHTIRKSESVPDFGAQKQSYNNNILNNISNTNNTTPDRKTSCSPANKSKTNNENIMDMILNADSNNIVTFYDDGPKQLPTSILKNHICPRNPSFPDKWLTAYQNLKESEEDNPRKLATMMNFTCQQVVDNALYFKKKSPPSDWTKSIQGTNFYERNEQWVDHKQRKMDYLKYMISSTVSGNLLIVIVEWCAGVHLQARYEEHISHQ